MPGRTNHHERPLKLSDGAHFFRSLIAAPRLTGAVAPSGRPLARAMARAAGRLSDGLVVELGPGTGPVTRALLERGLDRRRLVLVEYDPRFCRMLEARFRPAAVIEGDAYDLPRTLGPLARERIAAIVSSLPLLNQPPHRREKLIRDAFDLMGPDSVFVQFTYGLLSPIPREICVGRYSAHRGAPVWLNLPPARVWTYRLDARAGRIESALGRLNHKAERLRLNLADQQARAAEALERHGRILRDGVARRAASAVNDLKSRRRPARRGDEDER
jgi:phosphatidylethanolamine/phosphatidyl-N-methylethanolamine N-methyltransferase